MRLLVASVLIAALGTGAIAASERLTLYQAMAFTTGTDEAAQRVGFAAIEEVLAKVSGDQRLIGDPRVAALGEDAGAYVETFSFRDRMEGIPIHDEQGSRERPHDLTVTFDPDKIDAELILLGSEPWPEPRPTLALAVAVEFGEPFMLAVDSARGVDMRAALAIVSERVGLVAELPTSEEIRQAGITADAAPDEAALSAVAKRVGADLALSGTLTWSQDALGWIAAWRFDFEGETYRYGTSGVSFDGAFRNGLRGVAQVLSGNGAPGEADAP